MALIKNLIANLQRTTRQIFSILTDRPHLSIAAVSQPFTHSTATNDPLQFDGFLLFGGLGGAPKHKPGLERRRKKKRDMRRFYPFLKSWHMLVPCGSCGGFKKKFHLCETCYNQTRYETQQVREKLQEAGLDLTEETVVQYKNDNVVNTNARVFKVDRSRPSGWFSESFWGK